MIPKPVLLKRTKVNLSQFNLTQTGAESLKLTNPNFTKNFKLFFNDMILICLKHQRFFYQVTRVFYQLTRVFYQVTRVFYQLTRVFLSSNTSFLSTSTSFLSSNTSFLSSNTSFLSSDTSFLSSNTSFLSSNTIFLPASFFLFRFFSSQVQFFGNFCELQITCDTAQMCNHPQ